MSAVFFVLQDPQRAVISAITYALNKRGKRSGFSPAAVLKNDQFNRRRHFGNVHQIRGVAGHANQ